MKSTEEIAAKGIESIYVINTYDVFVQDAWGKSQNVGKEIVGNVCIIFAFVKLGFFLDHAL